MDYIYIPKRLQMVRKEIELLHPDEGDILEIPQNEEFKHLILELVALEKNQIKLRAIILTERQVAQIANYLPYNDYHVDMDNLFRIFSLRSSDRICEILYNQWQNSYKNQSCNGFIRELLNNDEHMITLMEKNHMTKEIFDSILQDNNIPLRVGKELMKYPFLKDKSLAEKFGYWGIRENSKLFNISKFLFFTYCNREDYLIISKSELLNLVEKYNNYGLDTLRNFMRNFLIKLKLRELQEFKNLAEYLQSIIGDNENNKKNFQKFFEDFDTALIRKYLDWMNGYKIGEYFGNDTRSEFWRKYRYESIRKYNYSDAVVMEFKDYYVVEFLGDRMGPIYIYPREYFNQYVRHEFRRKSNSELRGELFHNTKWFYRQVHYRREDKEYWKDDVDKVLKENHITERLDF